MNYWIETMLTLSSPAGSKTPGKLVSQVGMEYLLPIVPPYDTLYFVTTPQQVAARGGLPIYMMIPYQVKVGYLVPGAFLMVLITGGITAFNGTVTGYAMEQGIECLYFMEPNSSQTAYVTNLTPLNQFFEMVAQFLIVSCEENYRELKRQLEKLQFPYSLPSVR